MSYNRQAYIRLFVNQCLSRSGCNRVKGEFSHSTKKIIKTVINEVIKKTIS